MTNSQKIGVAYVTRYGLTDGITEVYGAEVIHGRYLSYKTTEYFFIGPKDWTRTLASAELKVEEMVARKKASILKNLKKLESYRPKLKTVTARER